MKKLILISIFLLILSVNSLLAQENNLASYILNSAKELNLSEEIDFGLDTLELKNTNLFALGEVHGVAAYEKIKLKLFKYLYIKAYVRTLIVELGNSNAFLLNNYLKSGDTTLIGGFNTAEAQFWKDLRQFDIKNSGEIEIIGIDFERSFATIKSLEVMFEQNAPQTISSEIEILTTELKAANNLESKEMAFKRLQDFYNSNIDELEEYLGQNLKVLKSIIFNKVPFSGKITRDKYMVDNLVAHRIKNPDKKYFGYFGISHANRNFNNLIGRLNENTSFKNRITVFMPQYINCKTIYGGKELAVDNFGVLTQEKTKKLSHIADNLDHEIVLVNLKPLPEKYERLSSASDYLIILKNQN